MADQLRALSERVVGLTDPTEIQDIVKRLIIQPEIQLQTLSSRAAATEEIIQDIRVQIECLPKKQRRRLREEGLKPDQQKIDQLVQKCCTPLRQTIDRHPHIPESFVTAGVMIAILMGNRTAAEIILQQHHMGTTANEG